ncbi:pentatricopeptide repeat-containing protein At2g03880, mitochondrial-like [Wolffia australiana]
MPDRLKDAFTWTTAAGGLARAGRLSDALRLLKQSRGPQPEAWAAAVSGAQYRGAAAQALQIFREMLSRGGIARPAPHSFTSAAAAAADLSALSVGLQLLSHVMRRGLFSGNTLVANSLVSVFSKSGSLGDALRLFGLMRRRDVGSWNAIIGGLGCHGRGGEAITMFDRMRAAGFRPDWISFVGLLQGCSHCGRVDEGRRFFESMERDFGVRRRAEHYACMADLLARAGMLQEAAALAAALPADLAAASPRSLLVLRRASLRGCRGRSRRGELQADGGPAAQQRCCPEGRATGKGEVGCSWVQVRETVHLFAARDETHPQSPDIYAVLRLLNDAMTQH